MRKFSGRGSQTNHEDTPCHRAAAATRRRGLTRLCVKVKLVPRHLNRLDVSPERSYSHRRQLITQTSRLISPVKSDGRAYMLVRAYTLLTRYRMTFSLPFFCFSLHLPHPVASASGRVSEMKRKKNYRRNSDQGRGCASSVRSVHSRSIKLRTVKNLSSKKFRIGFFPSGFTSPPKYRPDSFFFVVDKCSSGQILP